MEKKEDRLWNYLVKMIGEKDGNYTARKIYDYVTKSQKQELSKAREEGRKQMKNEVLELEDVDVNQEGDMEKKGWVLVNAIKSLD